LGMHCSYLFFLLSVGMLVDIRIFLRVALHGCDAFMVVRRGQQVGCILRFGPDSPLAAVETLLVTASPLTGGSHDGCRVGSVRVGFSDGRRYRHHRHDLRYS
jgi:hypothetical protein